MTPAPLRERIADDEVVFGAAAWTQSPAVLEVYGAMGLDYAFVDLEHGGGSPYDAASLGHLTRAADVWGLELLVRLPTNEPAMVRKALDAGARTIVVPRVKTAADVERAVRAARFTYDGAPGERGVGFARSTTWGAGFPSDYREREDREVGVVAMIEQRAAIDNLEEILAVPELTATRLGRLDLAASYGTGDPSDPAVADAIAAWKEASREAGVPISLDATDLAAAREAIDEGARLLRLGDDMVFLREAVGETLREFEADL